MYVQWNCEERSCNCLCCAQAINITFCQYVFVALGIRHAMRMSHVMNCSLACSTIFTHIISQTARLKKVIKLF